MDKKYAYVLLLVTAVLLVGYLTIRVYNGGADGGKLYADTQVIPQTEGDARQTALNYNGLGFKILTANGDMAISPNMLASNIGLYAEGAVDNGRSQAEDMLGAGENLKENHAALIHALSKQVPSQDNLFTGLFMDKNVNPKDEFVATNAYYGTRFETMDFFDFVAVKNKINGLASEKTNGEITNVVGEIYPKTAMVMVSGLKVKEYFADEVGTVNKSTKTFAGTETEYFNMPDAKVSLYEDDKVVFVSIPLENGYNYELVMAKNNDLTGMTLADIKSYRDGAKVENVALSIPAPKTEALTELKEPLKNAGFTEAFNSTVVVKNLTKTKNVKLDKMDQFLSFELMAKDNINSTDAAARKSVVIDKAYYYMFTHEETGCNTVMGKKTK